MDWKARTITKEEAAEALRARAFTVTSRHCESCTCEVAPDRQIIHSRVAGLGADWDLDEVLAFLEQADRIAWATNLLQHDLVVKQGDRYVTFDVPRPERSEKVEAHG